MTGLRIDRTRAIKAAAAAGMALLAISILPGLLRPPAPPGLPADVGFAPSETAGAPMRAAGAGPARPRKPAVSDRRRAEVKRAGMKGRKREGAARSPPSPPSSPSPSPAQVPDQAPGPSTAAGPSPDAGPDAGQDAGPAPTASIYTPPPASPAPQPPPSVQTDGSQEFAPR